MNELASSHPAARFNPIRGFPLLALVLLGYNIATICGINFHVATDASRTLLQIPLISGSACQLGWNEIFILFGLLVMFVEVVKSTRSSVHSTMEHILSMLVFIIFLIQFLIAPSAGTTTFLLLGLMSLMDVMAGYAVSIAVARRDLNIGM